MPTGLKQVTAVIKSFLREPYLYECVRTLLAVYPDINIIVVDDSLRPGEEYSDERKEWIRQIELAGHRHVTIPFDSGLCVGRNLALDMAETPYILIGDDDFRYVLGTMPDKNGQEIVLDPMLEKMVKFLETSSGEFDLVGGRVFQNSPMKIDGKNVDQWSVRNYQGYMMREHDGTLRKVPVNLDQRWQTRAGLRYVKTDLTFNFFIAKASACRTARWNERIKVAYEHSDFFLRFGRVGGRVAFSPDPIVIHRPGDVEIPKLEEYKRFRMRKSDKQEYYVSNNIKTVVDFDGRIDHL